MPIEAGVVFYPGAKVDPHAYVPLAEKLADKGYLCVIAKMPFNLAFLGTDAASDIMDGYPQADSWWIAGHSLGGVAAAQYAAKHADVLEGIAFLASYPASDLSETGLSALSIYGSQDFVLNLDSLAENADKLPANAKTVVIEGGNHAGFGAYGRRKATARPLYPPMNSRRPSSTPSMPWPAPTGNNPRRKAAPRARRGPQCRANQAPDDVVPFKKTARRR